MKRIIATGMLGIMLLSAVQPTLAFHFCGGALASVGLAGAGGCCCRKATEGAACAAASADGVSEPAESCCSDYVTTLSTGDCRTVSGESAGQKLPDFASVCCLLPVRPVCGHGGARMIQHLSPPGGLALSGIDRLAFICILRI